MMLQVLLLAVVLANPPVPFNDPFGGRTDGEWVITDRPDSPATTTDPIIQPATPRRTRILFFTAPWCGPCKPLFKADMEYLEPAGWTFGGSECHVQKVMEDKALEAKYGVAAYPTYILIQDDREIRRSGNIGVTTIPQLWGVMQPKQSASKQPAAVSKAPAAKQPLKTRQRRR